MSFPSCKNLVSIRDNVRKKRVKIRTLALKVGRYLNENPTFFVQKKGHIYILGGWVKILK